MDSKETIKQYLALNDNITRTNQNKVEGENAKPLAQITSEPIMFWGIIGFVICWAAIFIMLSKRVRFTRKEIALNIQPLYQIPCKNCKFYSNEPHLKCAVNPSIVLTEQAIDCTDYCAKEKRSS